MSTKDASEPFFPAFPEYREEASEFGLVHVPCELAEQGITQRRYVALEIFKVALSKWLERLNGPHIRSGVKLTSEAIFNEIDAAYKMADLFLQYEESEKQK